MGCCPPRWIVKITFLNCENYFASTSVTLTKWFLVLLIELFWNGLSSSLKIVSPVSIFLYKASASNNENPSPRLSHWPSLNWSCNKLSKATAQNKQSLQFTHDCWKHLLTPNKIKGCTSSMVLKLGLYRITSHTLLNWTPLYVKRRKTKKAEDKQNVNT